MRSPQSLIKSCLMANAGRKDPGKLVNASVFRVGSYPVLLKQRSGLPRQAQTSRRHKELGTLWSWHPKPPLGLKSSRAGSHLPPVLGKGWSRIQKVPGVLGGRTSLLNHAGHGARESLQAKFSSAGGRWLRLDSSLGQKVSLFGTYVSK